MDPKYIQASDLQPGHVLVSAYEEWESDGRIKLGDPFYVKSTKRVIEGSRAVLDVRGQTGHQRLYRLSERVAILYTPIEGDDLNSIEKAQEVLTRHGYIDEAESLKRVVEQHNSIS
ncbi:Uncharacterised protein [Mycobacteroides abscessus]|nr:hypothetical protein [Mycobacteroides abscessus]CPT92926.1 Uncharacterised protein [Mycobacteroides abscessus]CPW96665.1 Uncharacterised protein [Mycobacteroides abscessus]CQA08118.1 Uncharacterised protein [Mycobacteroides abscessus]